MHLFVNVLDGVSVNKGSRKNGNQVHFEVRPAPEVVAGSFLYKIQSAANPLFKLQANNVFCSKFYNALSE